MEDIARVRDKVGDRVVVVSVSGGKDSTAMALYLTRELRLPHVRFVFADTGWEHPDTYTYIREVLTPLLGEIEWVGYPGGMAALCLKKGTFPSRLRRFCTSELKVRPILSAIRRIEAESGREVVNTIGIRAAESKARAGLPEWEWNGDYDCHVWRPLISWSEQMVLDMHKAYAVPPNPLYLRGASRVGCWPCIFALKKELAFIADTTPDVITRITDLESRVGDAAKARHEARGDTLLQPPTFFRAMGRMRSEGGLAGRCVPIADAVAWSRTAHGGRQYELFAPPTEPGCVRWGLCESMQQEGVE